MDPTPEIRLTLGLMARAGVQFYVQDQGSLACGCRVASGWMTDRCEQGVVSEFCSPEHEPHLRWVIEHIHDDDVDLRFVNETAVRSLLTLLSERVGEPLVPVL